MNVSQNMGKRALTTAVAAATMLWSVGFASFVAPLTAHAAAAGDLIKGQTLSTLYYYGNDGKRYAFPNEKTYLSWYSDFSGVQTISDSQLAAIPLGGNIMQRPGSFWVKIQSDPKTYAVTPNGVLRWIETESVASGLAGSSWNKFIVDVPDVFFADYTVGASLSSAASAYNGALVKDASGAYYVIQNGQKRPVTSAGFSANRLQSRFALSGSGLNLSGLPTDGAVSAMEASIADAAQLPATTVGGLTVSVASDTPAPQTVPSNASSVTFFKFKLSANSGSATVSQIVANMGGIGATSNFANVYLYDGETRLTNGRSVNSSSRQVTFSALNIALAVGQSKTMSIRADIANPAVASDTASFSIASANSIVGSASVTGSFPVVGNTMTFSATAAGSVQVDKNGTIGNPTLGQKGATIGKFKLTAGTEDVSVSAITLSVDRSGDHSNYKLWKGATLLAVGTPVVGGSVSNLVAFPLTNPLAISQGSNAVLNLTADIGGRSADDIKVAVDSSTDIVAVGSKYGFNQGIKIASTDSPAGSYSATGSTCSGTGSNCSFSTIIGGKLTFAFNGPTAGDIQVDSKDQLFMNLTLTSQNAVELDEMDITAHCTTCTNGTGTDGGLMYSSTQANLTNITIRKADGTVFMGPMELALSSADGSGIDVTQTLAFKDTQNLAAGASVDLKVTANVYSLAATGNVFTMAMDPSLIKAKDVNNKSLTNATDIVPTSTLTSNGMTAKAAGLTVALSQPPSTATYVVGTNNVPVVGFAFSATKSSDITLTDMSENVVMVDDAAFNTASEMTAATIQSHVSSCSIYDAASGALIDGPRSVDSNKLLGFTNFMWTVKAGETDKILTKCNFANLAPADGATGTDTYKFSLNAATGTLTANDAAGKTLTTITGYTGSNVNGTAAHQATTNLVVISMTYAGSITGSIDGSTPKATIVLGASTAVPVATYKFQATNEAFTITDLKLSNCVGGGTSTSSTPADAICASNSGTATSQYTGGAVGTDQVSAAVKISYQNKAGDTITKTGFLSGHNVAFSGLDFYVPTSAVRTLTVSIDTNNVSSVSGVTSGSAFQLDLTNSAANDFKAVGEGSGTTVTSFSSSAYGTVAANEFVIRKTKPTITLASGSPSGAGVPGLSELFRFNVAADSRGFVKLDGITFKVTSTDNAGSNWNALSGGTSATHLAAIANWKLYDVADPSTAIAISTSHNSVDFTSVAAFLKANGFTITTTRPLAFYRAVFSTPEQIGAGQTKTYSLKVDTTGASSSQDDSIRIDIPDQATTAGLTGTLDGDAAKARNAISWEDDIEVTAGPLFGASTAADVTATTTDGTITNGSLIKNLPVTGGTIVY